jgi:hypothetical protein
MSTMVMEAEAAHRDSDRVPFAAQLMVLHDGRGWFADLYDLSAGGCAVFRPDGWSPQIDDLVQLFFRRSEGAAGDVAARVARVTTSLVGFEYHDPQPVPPCA